MSRETKRLAIVAAFCFFPTALAGWMLYGRSEKQAVTLFRCSVYIMMAMICIIGLLVIKEGGGLIKPMGSFF